MAIAQPAATPSEATSVISFSSTDEKTLSTDSVSPTKGVSPADATLSPLRFTLIMSVVLLSMFLVSLDRTILSTAIPAITDEFHSVNDIAWYGAGYMLTNASLQPALGRIYKHHDLKLVYLASILIFTVGSAVCGAAPSSVVLIIGRAIAGAGAAGIFSGSVQIIIVIIPLEKRAMYMAGFMAIFGLSSAVAPLIGGAFTSKVTWRWCFYLSLPIGALAMLVVATLLDTRHIESELHGSRKEEANLTVYQKVKRLDPIGTLLLLPCIISLILALQFGGFEYAWSDGRVIALWVVFGLMLIAFVSWQIWRGDDALLPPRIFKKRFVIGAAGYTFFCAGSFTTIVYYLPTWFQAIKGSTALVSSYQTLPFILSLFVASIMSGAVARKTGSYIVQMMLPPILGSIGAGLFTTLRPDTGHPAWIGFQVLYGLGIGCGLQGPSLAVQTLMPRGDVPIGMAALFLSQQMGGAIMIPIAQNLFVNALAKNVKKIPDLQLPDIRTLGATQLRNFVTDATLLQRLVEAYNASLRNVWIVCLVTVCLLVLPLSLIERKNINKVAAQQKADKAAAAEAAQSQGGSAKDEA